MRLGDCWGGPGAECPDSRDEMPKGDATTERRKKRAEVKPNALQPFRFTFRAVPGLTIEEVRHRCAEAVRVMAGGTK